MKIKKSKTTSHKFLIPKGKKKKDFIEKKEDA